MRNSSKLIWLGLMLSLLLLACRVVTPAAPPTLSDVTQPVPQVTREVLVTSVPRPVIVSDSDIALIELYSTINPSVVNVIVYSVQTGQLTAEGQGSGFVYDDQGHIITNAHVVHGAEQIDVTFSDASIRKAELVGEDLNSDLAVIRVDNLPAGADPLPLGAIDSLAVGQSVVAIGNPFGLDGTLTRGIISALGRTIPALTPFSIPQAIQTDAAINPGNSGGPLLNLNGEVIGVNAQIETGGTGRSNLGIGFAIPVSIMKRVIPDLIQNGEHEWAWLGVRGGSLNPYLVQAMDLSIDRAAYIAEVIRNGPSDKSGLRGADQTVTVDGREVDAGGDVITAIDGQEVRSFDDLLIYIALESGPGDEVVLTVLRDGRYQDIPVRLEKRPASLDTTILP